MPMNLSSHRAKDAPHWTLAPHRPAPRHAQRLLIAVATTDGAHVDRDFENTEAFLLYERAGQRTCYVGRQPCPLTASGTASGADIEQRTHLLADCDMVLCSNISPACKQTLSDLGIDCNLAPVGADIDVAVSTLRRAARPLS